MTAEAADAGVAASMLAVPRAAPRPLAVEVRGLEKTFRVPMVRVDTLKERAVQLFSRTPYRELNALRGIGFDIHRGEFFGIVGRNGSGKSTLLKLLASIYRADAGSIRIAGRVAPCIELGVGFNPDLSAHENVALNGVMMGLSPREARRRFDEVIEFAELGEFTEMKLKNYSSGMLVRLGFSLMTHVDADVLLIDEVLAVGDASFQRKCFDAFARLHDEGRTIVLVTHDMSAVERHCDRAILLEDGVVESEGAPADVTRRYLELNFGTRAAGRRPQELGPGGSEPRDARFVEVNLTHDSGEPAGSFEQGEPIQLEIVVEAIRPLERPVFGFQIVNADGLLIFAPEPFPLGDGDSVAAGERVRVRATIANPMTADHYFVHCAVAGPGRPARPIAFRKNAADFIVFGTRSFGGVVGLDYQATAARERS
jgi:ABC-type polysaccharide/polyol phosphate transport system ATPase subunit